MFSIARWKVIQLTAIALGIFKVMLCVCAGCGVVYGIKKSMQGGVSHGLCNGCHQQQMSEVAALKELKKNGTKI